MNWPLGHGETEQSREFLVNRLGNLTLLTQKLNTKISNGPWLGEEGKRKALQEQSTLLLNKQLCEKGASGWGVHEFEERNLLLTEEVIQIWPVPVGHEVGFQTVEGGVEVAVSDLINSSLIAPGATLVPAKEKYLGRSGTICADGRIQTDDGMLHASLSGAGKHISGRQSIAGWGFWVVEESGQSLNELRNIFRSRFELPDSDEDLESED